MFNITWLIKNILKFLTVAVVIIIILNVFGIDTTSILASLGIVGVVLGLACQDIAKDLLAGIFIIFDNQYAVGDYIEINGFMGEVVELGLKTTKIKAYSGEVKSISNSSFTEVLNYNLSNYRLILKINLDYDCDLAKVEQVLEGLRKEIENMKLVKKYTLLGIDNYEESYMRYSIEVECKAMQQYGIKRAVYKLIYNSFRENEIKIASNKIRVEK